ncbi:response regulator receiver domain-containing protein [Roseiarcus fermentans]|uniref:Response regulator receiver domain-containing protein n=1 Tax=Roseiarcus fermentans TaxID=1473586 RepID=A0A366FPC2_9HYPH|nr:response regulator [Roseiarcus fermentans]RBP15565.1 response regulator receiver domain-containing protein [Roseiarcus fermentans]
MPDSDSEIHAPPQTILFVEDEPLVRMDMAEFLRECGYRVHEAANADEAREALQAKFAVDLVFTDINLPGEMNGLELAEWISNHRPGVKTVTTTGGPVGRDGPPGGRAFLAKPYTGRALLDCVKEALKSADDKPDRGG